MRRVLSAVVPMALLACAERQDEPQGPVRAPSAAVTPERPPSPEEQPPPPPGAAQPSTRYRTYYESRYGVTRAEGERRMANEQHVSALSQWLMERQPLGFSSIRIQHEPDYAIVIAWKGEPDRTAILAQADPSLRGDIRFERARRNAREIERDGDRIITALRPIRAQWSGGYDVLTQLFRFRFESSGALQEAQRRIPADLRDDVRLEIGSVPRLL